MRLRFAWRPGSNLTFLLSRVEERTRWSEAGSRDLEGGGGTKGCGLGMAVLWLISELPASHFPEHVDPDSSAGVSGPGGGRGSASCLIYPPVAYISGLAEHHLYLQTKQ